MSLEHKPCTSLGLALLRETSFPAPFYGISCDHIERGVMRGRKHGPAGKTPTLAPFYHRLL